MAALRRLLCRVARALVTATLLTAAIRPWPAGAQEAGIPFALDAPPPGTPQPAGRSFPPYGPTRTEEDYRYLARPDPTRPHDFFDPVKYLPLDSRGDVYLTLGGETRQRYELYHDYPFPPAPRDAGGYDLQRYLLHADLHLGEGIRLFAQFKSALVEGQSPQPAPFQEDRADLNQAFVDLRLSLPFASPGLTGPASATLRGGRQELDYGIGRLLAVREGPNNRQAFDGFKLMLDAGGWRADLFLVKPVEDDRAAFNDQALDAQTLWSVYVGRPLPETLPVVGGAKLEGYYFGFLNSQAAYNQGRGREERHTLGVHLSGTHPVSGGSLDYDLEGTLQFGHFDNAAALPARPAGAPPPTPAFFGGNGGPSPALPMQAEVSPGDGNILAYSASAIVGLTLEELLFSPRVSLEGDLGSGDGDASGRRLGTFNPLFPRGQYFDEAAFFDVANLVDVRPAVDWHLTKGLVVVTDAFVFWRQNVHDGLYSPSNQLLIADGGNRARFVGAQATGRLVWQLNRHLVFEADYTHLFAGDYLRGATPRRGGGQNADFVAAWLQFKF